ncbi:hypothetical protein I7I51_06970 [Histoplasma capsulatum]|uniref:Uncharacterized protein n=1 Tax=Ajellomyces capsulatus TaxID=5037 RepID=A0A8A1MJP4_AJECA|nr:hypothetical protein I7I51_06970 [Histoplasma capsulatum]
MFAKTNAGKDERVESPVFHSQHCRLTPRSHISSAAHPKAVNRRHKTNEAFLSSPFCPFSAMQSCKKEWCSPNECAYSDSATFSRTQTFFFQNAESSPPFLARTKAIHATAAKHLPSNWAVK